MPSDSGEYWPAAATMEILSRISRGTGRLSVRALADELGLSKTTVHRVLNTLEKRGYIEQDQQTGRFVLGTKVLELVGARFGFSDLRDRAYPLMRALQERTGETVSLHVREGTVRICIERLESTEEIRSSVNVGRRLPLHAGAAGKVLLAFLPMHELVDVLDHCELTRLAEHTITEKERLIEHLLGIARQGYATSFQERVPWAASVAAPVFDGERRVVAALNVTGPLPRFEGSRLTTYIQAVTGMAAEISCRNGLVQTDGAGRPP